MIPQKVDVPVEVVERASLVQRLYTPAFNAAYKHGNRMTLDEKAGIQEYIGQSRALADSILFLVPPKPDPRVEVIIRILRDYDFTDFSGVECATDLLKAIDALPQEKQP